MVSCLGMLLIARSVTRVAALSKQGSDPGERLRRYPVAASFGATAEPSPSSGCPNHTHAKSIRQTPPGWLASCYRTQDRRDLSRCGNAVQSRGVVAEDAVHVRRRQEIAIAAEIFQRLAVGAEALNIRHVGAPHQLLRTEAAMGVADQRVRLAIRILPAPAPGDREHKLGEEAVAAQQRFIRVRQVPAIPGSEELHRNAHREMTGEAREPSQHPAQGGYVVQVVALVVA